ncbi:MAG: response regulator [Thermoanaerobaculia bacterium]
MQNLTRIDGTGRNIIVIDDDLAIRVLLQAVLQRLHFTVDLAEDGSAGIEKVRRNRYDLILLDLMMPKVNGFEFLETLKREGTHSPPPHVIVFTAAGPRGVERIPPDSVCNSILKPFDLEAFLEMIASCLAEHQAESG